MNGSQFLPRNVFKGVNADGSKFTVTQWEYGSIDIFSDGEVFQVFLGLVFTMLALSLVSPILLIVSLLSYNGKIKKIDLIGIIGGFYYLIDTANEWLAFKFSMITFDKTLSLTGFTDKTYDLAIISIIGLIMLSLLSIITQGSLFENKDETINNTRRVVIVGIGSIIAYSFFKYLF